MFGRHRYNVKCFCQAFGWVSILLYSASSFIVVHSLSFLSVVASTCNVVNSWGKWDVSVIVHPFLFVTLCYMLSYENVLRASVARSVFLLNEIGINTVHFHLVLDRTSAKNIYGVST